LELFCAVLYTAILPIYDRARMNSSYSASRVQTC